MMTALRSAVLFSAASLGSSVSLKLAASSSESLSTSAGAAALFAKAQECSCTFHNTCSCDGSVQFMQCIADSCASKKCNCDNYHFTDSCTQMSELCPTAGLQCAPGNATCTGSNGQQLSAAWERRAVNHKKSKSEEKADAKVPVDVPEFFPVPTTSRCVVIICVQYMLVLKALAIVRTYHEFSGSPHGVVENSLKACFQTLTYGPMLCVLFIAVRMRVEFLSGGKDQPQSWVQDCMYATTFALALTTCLALALPLILGKPATNQDGELEKPQGGGHLAMALTVTRYIVQLCMYGGIIGIIYGLITYTPPGAKDWTKLPPPAPAVECTVNLTLTFFAIQLVIALARSYTEHTGNQSDRIVGVMNAATETVRAAPMLAIVFLAARMRALQHDGQPQKWAQDCMYSATNSMVFMCILAIIVPLLRIGEMRIDPATGQQKFEMRSPTLGYVFTALRYLTMVGMYAGVCGVIYSIFVFEAPAGKEHTLPVSPTVQCVVNLCQQYFFIFLALNILVTVCEFTGSNAKEYRIYNALEASKVTVEFAPMLAILFVTTRMYALLLTDNKGAPPEWVQDGMFMATHSVGFSFTMCLLMAAVSGEVSVDKEGNVVSDIKNKTVATCFTVARYVAMVMLYGGILLVVYGLFTMTPETANGRGSIPVVSDVTNATPVGSAPPAPPVNFLHSGRILD